MDRFKKDSTGGVYANDSGMIHQHDYEDRTMKKEGVRTECPRCGNIWLYKRRSNGMYTTCPACRYLFKNPGVKE